MSNYPGNEQRNHGFTLLEVLVAFSIAALALGVMYRIYANGTTSAILGKEYAAAIAIAESKLAAVGAVKSLENNSSGIEDAKYQWRITIRDYKSGGKQAPGFGQPLRLKKIDVKVSWTSLGRQRSLELHTLRPAPL